MEHYRQRLYGLLVESLFPISGTNEGGEVGDTPDLVLSWQPRMGWDRENWRTIFASPEGNPVEISEAADGHACLAMGEELRCIISPKRDQVVFHCHSDHLEHVPMVVLNFVMGLVIHLRGGACLHGSVVERHGAATVIMGASGAGKSSLTAALVQRGATLVSDDLTVLSSEDGAIFVEPGFARLRLTQNAADHLLGSQTGLTLLPFVNKLSWDLSENGRRKEQEYSSKAVPLEQIYVLQAGGCDSAVLHPPLPRETALGFLIANIYPPRMLQLLTEVQMRTLVKITAQVPVRQINYTKKWELLDQLLVLIDS